jgi:hypothetical protein
VLPQCRQCFSRCRTLHFRSTLLTACVSVSAAAGLHLEVSGSVHVPVFQPLQDSALRSGLITACVSVSAAAGLHLEYQAQCIGCSVSVAAAGLHLAVPGSLHVASVSAAAGLSTWKHFAQCVHVAVFQPLLRAALGISGSMHVAVFQALQDCTLKHFAQPACASVSAAADHTRKSYDQSSQQQASAAVGRHFAIRSTAQSTQPVLAHCQLYVPAHPTGSSTVAMILVTDGMQSLHGHQIV